MYCWPNCPWLVKRLYRSTIPISCYSDSMLWPLVLCWIHHFPVERFCYFVNSKCVNYSARQKLAPKYAVVCLLLFIMSFGRWQIGNQRRREKRTELKTEWTKRQEKRERKNIYTIVNTLWGKKSTSNVGNISSLAGSNLQNDWKRNRLWSRLLRRWRWRRNHMKWTNSKRFVHIVMHLNK